jgi:hypothetical protein
MKKAKQKQRSAPAVEKEAEQCPASAAPEWKPSNCPSCGSGIKKAPVSERTVVYEMPNPTVVYGVFVCDCGQHFTARHLVDAK